MEKSLVILKPDALKRGLVGRIITRIENKNFKIINMKLTKIKRDIAIDHYEHLKELPNFDNIINYITSGPVIVMVVEGNNVIKILRAIIGKTDPLESLPGTIRGDYGSSMRENLVHSSDSSEAANIEIERFFSGVENEIVI